MAADIASIVATIDPVKLLTIIPIAEAERLSGLSHDTLRRRYPEKVIRLSSRRIGMRLADALFLNKEVESNNT